MPAIASDVVTHLRSLSGPPDAVLTRAILRNYHGKCPGDHYVVFESHHFVNEFDELRVAARRAARLQYDNPVPRVCAVGKLTVLVRTRLIASYEPAPILASSPGIGPLSGSIGDPVVEGT